MATAIDERVADINARRIIVFFWTLNFSSQFAMMTTAAQLHNRAPVQCSDKLKAN
jgi:hypothetical protein